MAQDAPPGLGWALGMPKRPAGLQAPPGGGQPAPDRAFFQPELPRDLGAPVALKKTKHKRRPIDGGQALDFVVENDLRFPPGVIGAGPA